MVHFDLNMKNHFSGAENFYIYFNNETNDLRLRNRCGLRDHRSSDMNSNFVPNYSIGFQ